MKLSKELFLSILILFVLANSPFINSVRTSPVMWSQTYGGTTSDSGEVIQTTDGGFAIACNTNSFGGGASDFWLIKTDASGNMEWNQTYGGPESDVATALVQTFDGGYAIVGYTPSLSGDSDFWLIKTNSQGKMEWNQTYGDIDVEKVRSVVETSDGGYALAGYKGNLFESTEFWLVKTDADGNMEWNQTYRELNVNSCYDLVKTSDGGFALAGQTGEIVLLSSNSLLVKTDSNGKKEWGKTYLGGSVRSLIETSDKGFALAGINSDDFWLIKTDAYGNMEWNQTYGGTETDHAYSLIETSDGGYALAGFTASFGAGGYDFWLVKTDADGNMEWNQTYGGTENDVANSLVDTSDGGYAIAGVTASFGVGDCWLIKTDEYGVIPEFPSWTILPLLLLTTVVVMVYRKK
jgi:hypothetical protein